MPGSLELERFLFFPKCLAGMNILASYSSQVIVHIIYVQFKVHFYHQIIKLKKEGIWHTLNYILVKYFLFKIKYNECKTQKNYALYFLNCRLITVNLNTYCIFL